MSKYGPLETHLRRLGQTSVPMTFGEIERVIGAKLPPSAFKHRPWWSNNPSNSVVTHAWLGAGYRTAKVDMTGRKLVFRKSAPPPGSGDGGRDPDEARHPGFFARIFGALAGTVTVPPGTDLTAPADEKWDAAR